MSGIQRRVRNRSAARLTSPDYNMHRESNEQYAKEARETADSGLRNSLEKARACSSTESSARWRLVKDADGRVEHRSRRRALFARGAAVEKSVIVFGAMEATLTPLMQAVESKHPGIKVFSLPSVDHPEFGRRQLLHRRTGFPGDPLDG